MLQYLFFGLGQSLVRWLVHRHSERGLIQCTILNLLPAFTALFPLGIWNLVAMLPAYRQHIQDTMSSTPAEEDSPQTKNRVAP